MDRDLRYIYASPNLKNIFGLAAEGFLGRRPGDVPVPNYDSCGFESRCSEAIYRKQPTVHEFEYRGRHYRTRIIPECSSEARAESVVTISEDVTERLRAELELRNLTARLFNLQDERRRIARGAATVRHRTFLTDNPSPAQSPSLKVAALRAQPTTAEQALADGNARCRSRWFSGCPPVLARLSERVDSRPTPGVQDIGRRHDIETAPSNRPIRRPRSTWPASARERECRSKRQTRIADMGYRNLYWPSLH
jgi:PAS domain S-box-containing protein